MERDVDGGGGGGGWGGGGDGLWVGDGGLAHWVED
jgi:hypothetical protein